MDGVEIRRFRAVDRDGVQRVRDAVRSADGHAHIPEADDPWARVVVAGGEVVGYSWVDFWSEQDGTRLYLLSGCVDPAWRRRGIGRRLLAHQEDQAAAHWHAARGTGPVLLGSNGDPRLLEAAGYRVRFTVVRLARNPATATSPSPTTPEVVPLSGPTPETGPPSRATPEANPPSQASPPSGPTHETGLPSRATTKASLPIGPTPEDGPPTRPAAEFGSPAGATAEAGPPSRPTTEVGPPAGPTPEAGPPSRATDDVNPPTGPTPEAGPPAGRTAGGGLPAGVEVRPVRPGHHPHIHRVIQVCFDRPGLGQHGLSYADYQADISDEDLWLVAWSGDEIAGLLINTRRPDGSVDTPWVAVPPGWRRRGIARALLRRSLALLHERGVRTATISTVQENPDHTVTLYESAGYTVTERLPRYGKPLPDQNRPSWSGGTGGGRGGDGGPIRAASDGGS